MFTFQLPERTPAVTARCAPRPRRGLRAAQKGLEPEGAPPRADTKAIPTEPSFCVNTECPECSVCPRVPWWRRHRRLALAALTALTAPARGLHQPFGGEHALEPRAPHPELGGHGLGPRRPTLAPHRQANSTLCFLRVERSKRELPVVPVCGNRPLPGATAGAAQGRPTPRATSWAHVGQ